MRTKKRFPPWPRTFSVPPVQFGHWPGTPERGGSVVGVLETTGEKKEKAVMRVRLAQRRIRGSSAGRKGGRSSLRGLGLHVRRHRRHRPRHGPDLRRRESVLRRGPGDAARPDDPGPSRGENQYWVAAPDPADPMKTILAAIEIPFDGYAAIQEADPKSAVVGLKPEVK